jgi:hypothetical protein
MKESYENSDIGKWNKVETQQKVALVKEIRVVESMEQRIGKVGKNKVNEAYRHQQSLEVDRRKEAIKTKIMELFKVDQFEAAEIYDRLQGKEGDLLLKQEALRKEQAVRKKSTAFKENTSKVGKGAAISSLKSGSDTQIEQMKKSEKSFERIAGEKAEKQYKTYQKTKKNIDEIERLNRVRDMLNKGILSGKYTVEEAVEIVKKNGFDPRKFYLVNEMSIQEMLDRARGGKNVEVEEFTEKDTEAFKKEKARYKWSNIKTGWGVFNNLKDGGLRDIFEPIFDRIEKISGRVATALMRYETNTQRKLTDRFAKLKPFVEAMEKVKKKNQTLYDNISLYLVNGNIGKANNLLEPYGVVVPREVLDEVWVDGADVGYKMGYENMYYPRQVVDAQGLIEFFTKEDPKLMGEIDKIIAQLEKKN